MVKSLYCIILNENNFKKISIQKHCFILKRKIVSTLFTMDTCQFSYISRTTYEIVTALGIEQCWNDIKSEFELAVGPLSGAKYYKTISLQGPQLFAVKSKESVWYHDEGQWFCYRTACDIKQGVINDLNPKRAQNEIENAMYFDKISEQPQDQYGINDEY